MGRGKREKGKKKREGGYAGPPNICGQRREKSVCTGKPGKFLGASNIPKTSGG